MNKILLFSTIFFLLTFNYLTAQKTNYENSEYRVLYKYKYQRDSTDVSNTKTATMELLIGKNYSLFQSLATKFNDSLYNANKSLINNASSQAEIFSVMSERKKDRLKYKIIKHENKVTFYSQILLDRYKYNETLNIKWKILSDTLTINSYKCQKATASFSGRDYIAWFTKKIPISDGPYKFKGLPGLIVKIYDTKNHHIFELISFEKYSLPIILTKDTDKPIQKITKEQYFKTIKSFKDNPTNYFSTRMKMVITGERSQRERFISAGKRFKANEIELKFE